MAIANVNNLRARNLKVHVVNEATAAALKSTVNTWLLTLDEEVIVDIQFQLYTGIYAAMILYTE